MKAKILLMALFFVIITENVMGLDCTNGYPTPAPGGKTATQACIDAGYPGCAFFCCANPLCMGVTPCPAAGPCCWTSCGSIIAGNVCCSPPVEEIVNKTLCNIVLVLWAAAVGAAALMIVVGGLKWMGAMEDVNARAQAKTTVIHAIIGLIIVVIAMWVVNWMFIGAGTFAIYQFNCSP